MHVNLSFRLREDLSINCDAIHSLSIEISSTKWKNIILKTIYRPPNGDVKQCETRFKDVFSKNAKNLKNIILAGDFNINSLDLETNKNVQDFLNLIFRYTLDFFYKQLHRDATDSFSFDEQEDYSVYKFANE